MFQSNSKLNKCPWLTASHTSNQPVFRGESEAEITCASGSCTHEGSSGKPERPPGPAARAGLPHGTHCSDYDPCHQLLEPSRACLSLSVLLLIRGEHRMPSGRALVILTPWKDAEGWPLHLPPPSLQFSPAFFRRLFHLQATLAGPQNSGRNARLT